MAQAATSAVRGIGFWMERVLAEHERAREKFDADAVHDLRVAIRRCRSMAEAFQAVDGDLSWKRMRKAAKGLFSALGGLRDTQVLLEWTERLQDACPPVADRLRLHCEQRETALKATAAEALANFDAPRWQQWAQTLEQRVQRLNSPGEIFEVLALERYQAARALQARALRNRSKVALHQLRIGIKKFRYMVENFLPVQHAEWGKDLRQIQDCLGEIHDLDVLKETARQIQAFAGPEERVKWNSAILRERGQREQLYRQKMVGKGSVWQAWRMGLPAGEALRSAVLKRFATWAETLDSRPAHAHTATRFSLQLYDAMSGFGILPPKHDGPVSPRDLLEVAALAHEVGRSSKNKAHHKISRRMLQGLEVPPGWSVQDLQVAGLIARFHRGALPGEQQSYGLLSPGERAVVDYLAGVLRLADSLASYRSPSIRSIQIRMRDGRIEIAASGYLARSRAAERVAAARHLLEYASGFPVLVLELG